MTSKPLNGLVQRTQSRRSFSERQLRCLSIDWRTASRSAAKRSLEDCTVPLLVRQMTKAGDRGQAADDPGRSRTHGPVIKPVAGSGGAPGGRAMKSITTIVFLPNI